MNKEITMSGKLIIRPVGLEDAAQWRQLWDAYNNIYQHTYSSFYS
jgi:hypothetical protein